MSDTLKKLTSFYESEEGKAHLAKYWEDRHRIQDSMDRRSEQLHQYLSSLSDDTFLKVLKKFIDWEEKLEEHEYTVNHTQTSSYVFGVVCNMFENYGTCPLNHPGEPFLGEAVLEYRDIRLKTYHGQGTFHRLVRGEEIIFQTT